MSDLIDRQAAIKALSKYVDYSDDGEQEINTDCVFHTLEELPSAQPERKTGRWIEQEEYWECPACKDQFVLEVGTTPKDARMFYCPNCGAKMEIENAEALESDEKK